MLQRTWAFQLNQFEFQKFSQGQVCGGVPLTWAGRPFNIRCWGRGPGLPYHKVFDTNSCLEMPCLMMTGDWWGRGKDWHCYLTPHRPPIGLHLFELMFALGARHWKVIRRLPYKPSQLTVILRYARWRDECLLSPPRLHDCARPTLLQHHCQFQLPRTRRGFHPYLQQSVQTLHFPLSLHCSRQRMSRKQRLICAWRRGFTRCLRNICDCKNGLDRRFKIAHQHGKKRKTWWGGKLQQKEAAFSQEAARLCVLTRTSKQDA